MTPRIVATAIVLAAIFALVWWQASLLAAATAVLTAGAVTVAFNRAGR